MSRNQNIATSLGCETMMWMAKDLVPLIDEGGDQSSVLKFTLTALET